MRWQNYADTLCFVPCTEGCYVHNYIAGWAGWQLWHQIGSWNAHKLISVITGSYYWAWILWVWPERPSCHGNGVSWSPIFCCNGTQNHAVGCAWWLDTRRCSNGACSLWNCELKNKISSELFTSHSNGFTEATFLLDCNAVCLLPWRWMYVCSDLHNTSLKKAVFK